MPKPQKKKVKIVAIIGSVRPNNYTSKALAIAMDELKKYQKIQSEIIDPSQFHLSLIGKEKGSSWRRLQRIVSQATGVILTTPEYHGSYSSTIKLVIDNLGYPSALAGKPVALLGVASGAIGAIKALEHLRSVCSHIGAIVLPNPVSIAGINGVFDKQGKCLDKNIENRIRSVAANLVDYIEKHICPLKVLEKLVGENEGTIDNSLFSKL